MNAVKVFLADDHILFTDGLKRILEEKEGIVVDKIFQTGDALLEALNFTQPDIVFCDHSMPGTSGLEIAKIILKKYPKVKVIMLSMHETLDFVLPSIKCGVHGYIIKSALREELYTAIESIMNDNIYYSKSVESVIKNSNESRLSENTITKREKEILKQLSLGKSTKEIADILFISTHTVDTHRKNLLSKTNCKNSIELLHLSLQRGWLS